MGAGSFAVNTNFRAKDGVSPVFGSMIKGAGRFENRLSRLTRQSQGFGSCIQGTMQKINALINASFGFVAFDTVKNKLNSFVDSASDLQETVGKTGEVFKLNSAEIEKWAKTSIKSMGLAEQTALDTASLFGDMGTGMGMTTKRAAEMSMNLTQLSADLASFKNVEQSLAANALKGVFTGETEALKNMGVVMTETVLQEYARANGIRKKLKDMTQAEKIELRYQYVMKATTNAQGDFIRTFGNYANQKRVGEQLKKQAEINIGRIMLPVWNRFMVLYNTFFTNNLDNITKIFDKFFNYVLDFGKAFKPVFDELGKTFQIFATDFAPMLTELGPPFKNVFENVLVPGLILAIDTINIACGVIGDLYNSFKDVYSFVKDNFVPLLLTLATILGGVMIYNISQVAWGLLGMLVRFQGLAAAIAWNTVCVWADVTALLAQAAAFALSPVGLITIAIVALIAVVTLLWKNWDKVTETVVNWWNNTQTALAQFWEACKGVFGRVGAFIKENFIDILLYALGPIDWVIKGIKDIAGAFNNLKKEREKNGDIDLPDYRSGGDGKGDNNTPPVKTYPQTPSGTVTVKTTIDNNTSYPAKTSTNVTEQNNMTLVPG